MVFKSSPSYLRRIGNWLATIAIAASTVLNFGAACGAVAASYEYDASSGLLPQNVGWLYTDEANPPASAAVSGGVLTHNSAIDNRAQWALNPVPGTPGADGAFMEATARIVTGQHTSNDRGIGFSVGFGDGAVGSILDLHFWEDRIFINDVNDITVGTHFMDTTDVLHTYRVEILNTQYWVFVDNWLVFQGTTPAVPTALNQVGGAFGDGSAFSGGTTEWAKVRIGSLADVGGPTIPEPASFLLASLASGAFMRGRRSRGRFAGARTR